jgi:hypothetical protein
MYYCNTRYPIIVYRTMWLSESTESVYYYLETQGTLFRNTDNQN